MTFLDAQFQVQTSDVIAFSEPQRTAREMQVTLSIASEGEWLYKNLKYPRHKNFYGYAQLMSGAFVVQTIPLTFLNQELIHWMDLAFGINDTTVCMAKLLATKLLPPAEITGYVVKIRQRYTSIRFRLLGGIIANVSYVWEVAESNCDNEVREPDEKQGQPPIPNNGGASGSPRPSDQGGDPTDPSANDGGYDPNSGLQPPPRAGGGEASGTWKIQLTGFRQDDSTYTFQLDSEVSDPNAVVIANLIPTPGSSPNDAGKLNSTVVFVVNGVPRTTIATGFGLQLGSVYYY